MLERLAHFIVRRRRWVIGVWIVITLFGAFSASQVSKRWYQSFSIPGYSGYEANQRTLKVFKNGEQPPFVAVFHTTGDITRQTTLERAVVAAAAVNPGSRYSSYWSTHNRAYVSRDGHTAFAEIYPPGNENFTSTLHLPQVTAALRAHAPAGVQVHLTGLLPLENAASGGGNGPSVLTEALIGGLGALIILFFVFGTLPAVLMPIAVAIASILNTFTLVWALTYITNVSIIVEFLIALVGLGVAIDYALLMIFRFRDELREGEEVEDAIVQTMTHAGRSVIVSGSTVAVGLLSMIVLPLPFIRSIGIGGMLIPAVSVLTAITLLPALLVTLGGGINRVRLLPKRFVDTGHPEDGFWGRWARTVTRRPWPIALTGFAIVGVLVYCGLHLNPNEAQVKDMPGSGDAIAGRTVLNEAGISPGVMKPLDVLVEHGARTAAIVKTLQSTPGIVAAIAPAAWHKGADSVVEALPGRGRRLEPRAGRPDRHGSFGAEGNRGDARRRPDRGSRLRRRRVLELPVRPHVRRSAHAGPAHTRVPVDRARGQGGGAEPAVARGRLRDHRDHLPVGSRLRDDLARGRDPVDHPVDPVDDLRLPLWALDGLRGLHAHAHARGL
jgi:RND superfamily putative drug exporter